ncbi:F0F1 ATP synthase subunit C [Patescibacteria group bacterium]|nr:F0F1 ATP synthase subunit C [Patescibacteria group bacterium]
MIVSLDNNSFLLSVEETTPTSVNTEVVARRVGSGLATAGLGGVGTGIGLVFSGLIKGFSRNPSLKDDLFSYAIFGFALTEAIGLFALMMAFMLLYA